jgi:RHS repeat-associated protein
MLNRSQAKIGKGYTGHRGNMDLGLIYMNARYYVPGIGRFLSADTIVPEPGNPQSLDRYSYSYNNPIKYSDPDGHMPTDGCEHAGCLSDPNTWLINFLKYYAEHGVATKLGQVQVIELTPGLHVVVVPSGASPTSLFPVRENDAIASALGYLNALVDVGETGAAALSFFGFPPGRAAAVGLASVRPQRFLTDRDGPISFGPGTHQSSS